ncbi:maleylpyruvate isomerase N-terminal domain-containing protein [Streptomyces longwoodensis]|uniref:maleylpyruvate isomerase N-terminal domain-containing protein n=1 Tax=Streptomyces longwoodensis TaxID=68231 RepID=UPI003400929C
MTTTNPAGHPLPYDTYREAIGREARRFADAVRNADPAGAVPSSPGWTLADLTRHVGALQRWFSVLLSRRVQEASGPRPPSRTWSSSGRQPSRQGATRLMRSGSFQQVVRFSQVLRGAWPRPTISGVGPRPGHRRAAL